MFQAYLDKSPEEKEIFQKEVEAKQAQRGVEIVSTIDTHRVKIAQILEHIDSLPEQASKFIQDLFHLGSTFDRGGQRGGRLLNLSDKQVSYLDDLYQKYVTEELQMLPILPNTLDGKYIGKILEIENEQVIQKIGRDPYLVVKHDISNLSQAPNKNDVVTIHYSNGAGIVNNANGLER